jgi:ankyrin repeat protein
MFYHYPFTLRYNKKIVFELLHHLMCENGKVFSGILYNKPDLTVVDEDGNTLLHRAVELKNAEAIGLLIKQGALLCIANNKRKTPIDLLYDVDDQKCIKVFESSFIAQFFKTYSYQTLYKDYKKIIQSGFDVNMCDEKGQSMLWKAVKEHPEKLSFLLKYGAIVTQEMIDYATSEHQYAEMELLQKYLKK